ncbi:MAG: ribulose-phosphate 3-epimerase [Armatimonadetes bacterium]|nr:ribulose-phosphate 3-epimerase [Candidatus Hippobium faecium]
MKEIIMPSILSADFSIMKEQLRDVKIAGADAIHCDVMDGHFVPNITFGPKFTQDCCKVCDLPFYVHLMIENPDQYLAQFAKPENVVEISVHEEACVHLHRTIQNIKALGKRTCVALNPHTPWTNLDYVLEDLDAVLVMTVNPGFGGQKFIESQLRKIEEIRKTADARGLDLDIQIDGGIDGETVKKVRSAGANMFVAGSYVFTNKTLSMKEAISTLKK